MKDHFSRRSLIFYGCAIASVFTLFSVTSAYGEKHLQAPRRIDGLYPLALKTPIDCFQAKPVTLLLQQSGVFLTASILPVDASEQAVRIAQERPSLTGQWRDDQLTLVGQTGRAWNCTDSLKIDGKFTQDTLNGSLTLRSLAAPIPFSSDRQAPQSKVESH